MNERQLLFAEAWKIVFDMFYGNEAPAFSSMENAKGVCMGEDPRSSVFMTGTGNGITLPKVKLAFFERLEDPSKYYVILPPHILVWGKQTGTLCNGDASNDKFILLRGKDEISSDTPATPKDLHWYINEPVKFWKHSFAVSYGGETYFVNSNCMGDALDELIDYFEGTLNWQGHEVCTKDLSTEEKDELACAGNFGTPINVEEFHIEQLD